MKVLPAFFSPVAHLSGQDVSSGAKTRIGAAQTTMVLSCTFWACNGHLVPIASPKCVQHVPKVCLGIIHIYSKKMIW